MLLRILVALGYDYLLLDRSQEAMDLYAQALHMAERVEDFPSEGTAYRQLGQSSQDGEAHASAVNKALLVFELGESIRLSAQLRSLLGRILVKLARYSEAEDQLAASLRLAEQMNDGFTRGNALCSLAQLHNARGDYDRAVAVACEGLEVVRVSRDEHTEGQVHMTLSSAYEAKRDMAAAEDAHARQWSRVQ